MLSAVRSQYRAHKSAQTADDTSATMIGLPP
jgi:hypothetical protein